MAAHADNFGSIAARIGLSADQQDDVRTVADLSGKSPEEMVGLFVMMVLRGQGLFRRDVDDHKRHIAAARLGILQRWNAARRAGDRRGEGAAAVSERFKAELAAEGTRLTLATLYNWDASWRKAGMDGLIDARYGSKFEPCAFLKEVERLWRGNARLKLTECVSRATVKAKRQGWKVRS